MRQSTSTPDFTAHESRRPRGRLLIAGVACGALAFGSLATAPMAFAAPAQVSAVSAAAAAWPVVAQGENSANVRTLQHLLTAAGQPVDADGIFGSGTAAAVTAFQSARGLSADGIVGEQTWSALITTVSSGDSGDAVTALQVQLNKTGAGLTVDGQFGAATRAAVESFQSAAGLTVDGVAGPQTWQSLVGSGSGTTPEPGQPGETFATLSDEQLSNVRTIIAEGKAAGVPEYGWVIAIATAMQESRLRNLTGGDRDSVGLFQQRPSAGWGSASELVDPVYASRAFYGAANSPTSNRGLLDVPDWQSLSVTQAAQAVQVSAYPDAYAQWETLAREAVASEG
ncbi:peptidoglycan-binding domain-containing protein [Rathayibacter tanaceti]|uniref:Peptidoglycan-binding protein n=2 Tax=Rathayibacter tanaceti TaxID=1671680 RepID=A0A162FX64_9MICO|nr:peptidoglycan-binding protein [Rathayibacter tanaceti]KZX20850.1 Zinc D-Ala-D-Ala carboxypeptidase precursor [Rathayibacter tanaceti]QHC54966.1 peptidoglycan-binding protein [Rathayibacter tanaceti]TCO38510.1 peptidoglycan hydrolase-like protein with peptidoglycan-binding domain [Rathayibacter tanaceti]